MKNLFYYCLDQEILDLTKVLEKFSYDKVVKQFEIDLKFLTLTLETEDTISFSPSGLFESEVCRYIFVAFYESFKSGLFAVASNESSLEENHDKKKENYAPMSEVEKYKTAYYSSHPKGLFQMPLIFVPKNTITGKTSFLTWKDGITEERVNLSGVDTRKFNDFLVRLSNSEKKAFLWESVEIQAASTGLSARDLEVFRIRQEMSVAYLDAYAKAGFWLPVNGVACFPEKLKAKYVDLNRIKMVLSKHGLNPNFLAGKSVSKINKFRSTLFQFPDYRDMCELFWDSDIPKQDRLESVAPYLGNLTTRLVKKQHMNITNNIQIQTQQVNIMKNQNKYNVNAGIVAAVGTGSKAENNTFQQVYTASSFDIDLLALAEELKALRIHLRQRAKDDEDDRAVVSIGSAEAAARTGKHGDVINHLKSAGKWALDIASEVGSAVAVKAIETAMGL